MLCPPLFRRRARRRRETARRRRGRIHMAGREVLGSHQGDGGGGGGGGREDRHCTSRLPVTPDGLTEPRNAMSGEMRLGGVRTRERPLP